MSRGDWQIFDVMLDLVPEETIQKTADWLVFESLFETADRLNAQLESMIDDKLVIWNNRLRDFGGDPSLMDWTKFRPLRLDREEDWSDWLAFLISSSDSGCFAYTLFRFEGFSVSDYVRPPTVHREPVAGDCRGDVLVRWGDGRYTNIEIKIGDPGLEKTYYTARKLRERHLEEDTDWLDVIILMKSQVSDWQRIEEEHDEAVHAITWEEVALSLRTSLLNSEETLTWKAWAYAYLGAVEETLLRYPSRDQLALEVYSSQSWLRILTEALDYGE